MHFPKDFVWGTASASYQIEGGTCEDDKGPSIWDTFTHTPGKIADGCNGDTACDAYHRFEEDLDLMKELGIPNYRFSISWPRVIPDGYGTVSEKGLAYYDKVIDGCLARGITPWITLYHWDLPQALQDQGGWENRRTAEFFRDYVAVVTKHFGTKVNRYITLNEPQISIGVGYCDGTHAPGLTLEPEAQFNAWHNMMLAHGMAVQTIRANAPHAQVGVASCGTVACVPGHPEETPQEVADYAFSSHDEDGKPHHFYGNHWFLDPAVKGAYPADQTSPWYEYSQNAPIEDLSTICQPLDFIGLNIYHGAVLDPDNGYEPVPRYPGQVRTAFGWPITPEALYWGPRLIHERYGLPVMITENGRSCNDQVFLDGKVHDPDRIDYLQRYLTELSQAREDGIPVLGYFHWSLTDNFEWAEGFNQRFGLIYIDYRTCKRIPKDSAYWYSDLIRKN